MNYIKQLQRDNSDLANQINNTDHAINEFRIFLNSPKFTGLDDTPKNRRNIMHKLSSRDFLSLTDKLSPSKFVTIYN